MPFAVRRARLATLVTSLTALLLVPVAMAGNGGFLPGEPHSPNAHRVHDSFIFVSIFTGVIFIGVEGALIVKRIAIHPIGGHVTVQSDNPAYPDWPDCDMAKMACIGRVIWAGRRID